MDTPEIPSGIRPQAEAIEPTQLNHQENVSNETHSPLTFDEGEQPKQPRGIRLLEGQAAIVDGHEIPLTGREVTAIRLLEQKPGVVTSRDELIKTCWGETTPSADVVNAFTSKLRRKIGADKLITRPDRGWEFRPEGKPTLPLNLAERLPSMEGIHYVEKYDVIVVNGQIPELTAEEHFASRALAQNAGNLTTRDKLQQAVWAAEKQPDSPDPLDALISRLRKRLAGLEAKEAIETIRGEGYILRQAGKPPESPLEAIDSQTGLNMRVVLDSDRRLAYVDGKAIPLSSTKFKILKILEKKPYQFVTTEELDQAWPTSPRDDSRYGAMSRIGKLLESTDCLESRTKGYIYYRTGREAYLQSLAALLEGLPQMVRYVSQRQAIQVWIPNKGLQEIPLDPMENKLMAILNGHRNKITSPDQLKAAWEIEKELEGEPLPAVEGAPMEEERLPSIQGIVSSLRSKIGLEDCLVNIPNIGYIFYQEGKEAFFASQKSDEPGIVKPVADRRTVSVEGRECRVYELDYRVLEILNKNSGRVTTIKELKQAWKGEAPSPFGEAKAQVLHRLRRILGPLAEERLRTVQGIGVFFSADEMPRKDIDTIITKAKEQEKLEQEKELALAVPPFYDENRNPVHVIPDPEREAAIAGKWAIPLSDLEYDLLTILSENNHTLIPKSALSQAWGEKEKVSDDVISSAITELAARIGKDRIRKVFKEGIIYYSEGMEAFQAEQLAKGITGIRPEPERQAISIGGKGEIILRKAVYRAFERLFNNRGTAVRVGRGNLIKALRDVLAAAGEDSMRRVVGVYGEGYILFPDELPTNDELASLSSRGRKPEIKRRKNKQLLC